MDDGGRNWNTGHFTLILAKSVPSYQNERALSLLRCPKEGDFTLSSGRAASSLMCSVTVTSYCPFHLQILLLPNRFVCSHHDTFLLKKPQWLPIAYRMKDGLSLIKMSAIWLSSSPLQ